MSDATDHARALIRGAGRPDVSSIAETHVDPPREGLPDEGPTEQYERWDARPEATSWAEQVRAPGATDVQVDSASGGRASQITAAVEVLITVVERLEQRVEARTLQTEHTQALHDDLRSRHERLVETVQLHGGRLDEIDGAVLEVAQQRTAIRILLVFAGVTLSIVGLTLLLLVVLVIR